MVEDVDLEFAEPDDRRKCDCITICASHKRDHPREQLLRRKRDGQDVVNACLKSVQLGLHIATPGKTDYGQADPAYELRLKQSHDVRTVQIHLEDREMWLPLATSSAVAAVRIAYTPWLSVILTSSINTNRSSHDYPRRAAWRPVRRPRFYDVRKLCGH